MATFFGRDVVALFCVRRIFQEYSLQIFALIMEVRHLSDFYNFSFIFIAFYYIILMEIEFFKRRERMKRFYINERIFTVRDRFNVYREDGSMVYEVKEKLFTFGKQYRLFDMSKRQLAFIKQKLFRLLPAYKIYVDGKHMATVKKKFSVFVNKYAIQSDYGNYRAEGDFLAWDFKIYKDDNLICTVSKNFDVFRDKYEIAVAEGYNEILLLCMVIVFDAVHHRGSGHGRRVYR